jgi:hypothetical protein
MSDGGGESRPSQEEPAARDPAKAEEEFEG